MTSESFEDYRMGHLVRTAEVWKRLRELGATEETALDFDFSFEASSEDSVRALQEVLRDYKQDVESRGFFKKVYAASGSSGGITWTEEVLLKRVDYLIQIGEDCGATFNGCGASMPGTS